MTEAAFQRCIHPACGTTAALDDSSFQCPKCGGLMDVAYDWDRARPPASLAIYCAATDLTRAVIFIGSGKISYGKLAQALDHGALTVQIAGDFDDALARVQQVSKQLGIYLVNSINPFRLEGQKTIMYRVLEALRWEVPDWIVVPGGNLGNSSSFGKAFFELLELGLIDRAPRLAVINAAWATPFYQ